MMKLTKQDEEFIRGLFPKKEQVGPSREKIDKVFPGGSWERDDNIKMWIDRCTGFMSEEDLEGYIEKGLTGEKAWDYYDNELEKIKTKLGL